MRPNHKNGASSPDGRMHESMGAAIFVAAIRLNRSTLTVWAYGYEKETHNIRLIFDAQVRSDYITVGGHTYYATSDCIYCPLTIQRQAVYSGAISSHIKLWSALKRMEEAEEALYKGLAI